MRSCEARVLQDGHSQRSALDVCEQLGCSRRGSTLALLASRKAHSQPHTGVTDSTGLRDACTNIVMAHLHSEEASMMSPSERKLQ